MFSLFVIPLGTCYLVWVTGRKLYAKATHKALPDGKVVMDWRRAGHLMHADGSITLAKDR